MDYMAEINAFFTWLETHPISYPARNLWHTIMHVANRARWIHEFSVAVSVLEAKSGMSRSNVYRARNELTENGRITYKSRTGNQCAMYTIIPFASQIDTQSETQANKQKDESPPASQIDTQSETHSGTHSGTINKTNTNTNTISDRERFNRFWVAYPRKQKKSDAEKAFIKINPSDDLLQTMLDALTVQKKSTQWINENGKYIPYPTSWLNGKRWEDEPPPTGCTVTPKNPPAGTVGLDGRIANGYGQWEGPPTKIFKDGRWVERDTA